MSVDRRIAEAQERVYDRARQDGFGPSEARVRAHRAAETVARDIDRGVINPPPPKRGQ